MVRELRDSNTVVLTAKEGVDRRRSVAPQTGATLGIVEGRVAVLAVAADSPAARAGVRAGDVIVASNDTALDEALFERTGHRGRRRRALQRLLHAAPDAPPSSLRLTLQRATQAAPIEVELPVAPAGVPPRVELSRLDDGVAVLKLTRFSADVHDALRRAVEELAVPAR